MFVQFSEQEFMAVVCGGKRTPEIIQETAPNQQLVVGWRVLYDGEATDLLVKVYSSVFGEPGHGMSRAKGDDSIRVCVVDTKLGRGVGKISYVQRTTGWEDRLKQRVRDMFELAHNELVWCRQHQSALDNPPTCPKCSNAMQLRTARKGPQAGNKFWGCVGYPRCKGTANVVNVTPPRQTERVEVQRPQTIQEQVAARRLNARWD